MKEIYCLVIVLGWVIFYFFSFFPKITITTTTETIQTEKRAFKLLYYSIGQYNIILQILVKGHLIVHGDA